VPEAVSQPAPGASPFAHASEAELARILGYYGIEWQYEPTTFPILWNLEGKVVESFTPDFYLPEFDLYVELTTLKQSLVRKKNRKLRRLRDLYPSVRIKLLYARDFRALMMKYGRLGLLDSLSGTEGQVTAAHDEAPPPGPGRVSLTGSMADRAGAGRRGAERSTREEAVTHALDNR
jgi:hypoxanthine phosphoribosyltransferase